MVAIHGYKAIRQDRTTGKRGGGLIVYIKNYLYNAVTLLSNFSSVTSDIEQLWFCIEEENSRKKVYGLIYRPPAGKVDICLGQLRVSIESIKDNQNCELTVLGDLNVNYKNRNSAPFKLLKEIERDFGLRQLIEKQTRITLTLSTIIDLILTDCPHVSKSGTLDIYISDHLPIYYVRKKARECNPKKTIFGRSYKHYVKEDFQADIIDDMSWRNFWDAGPDVNMLWDVMLTIILYHANVYCPTVKMYVNENCPYWFSRDLIEEINHKNYLYRKAKASSKEEDWAIFKTQKNLTKRLIFSAKDIYINEQIDQNFNDSKKLWKNVNMDEVYDGRGV